MPYLRRAVEQALDVVEGAVAELGGGAEVDDAGLLGKVAKGV